MRRYLQPLRDGRQAPPARPVAPTVRKVTGWLLTRPTELTDGDRVRLKAVLALCPELEATAEYVHRFAEMLTGRHGDRLEDWLAAVEADDEADDKVAELGGSPAGCAATRTQ